MTRARHDALDLIRRGGWHGIGVSRPRGPPVDRLHAARSRLHRVVHAHLETFLATAASLRDGGGVPRFVEEEFRAFLRCGWLAGGFARFRCGACRAERLVAFSCKGRGFCPSCGGRRMTAGAAPLVDDVLSDVPVRQWVLTLPHPMRYLLAWRHDLCKGVVRVLLRAVQRPRRTRANAQGLVDVRGGAVAIVRTFGGALNLNIHVHALVLDGVFARDGHGPLRFHPLPALVRGGNWICRRVDAAHLDSADVADVLAAVTPERAPVTDAFAEATPLLAGLAAASVQGQLALAGTPGARPRSFGETTAWRDGPPSAACHARWEGFDLHAAVRVPAGQRARLERVGRYALRPPVAGARLRVADDGHVVL